MSQSNITTTENILQLEKEVLQMDSLFWESYNSCDVEKFRTFFTDDLEFYHDKEGLTTTLETHMESVETGLCGSENWRLRREAVKGSIKVFPLQNYGAILSGEHVFYIIENGEERLDGIANFTHVLQHKNNEWKMSRVISYDHRPAAYKIRKEITALPDEVLKQYAGEYEGPDKRIILISKEDGFLKLADGEFEINIYPEADNKFFFKDRDLQFEFIQAVDQQRTKMVVIEGGAIVEESLKLK